MHIIRSVEKALESLHPVPEPQSHSFSFRISGKPVGKARPRFFVVHGRAHAYTPKETHDYETRIRDAYDAACKNKKIASGPISIQMLAVFEPPKSYSRKKREALIGTPYMQKPDGDNILKTIDGLNGIAWTDDKQITEMSIRKVYGETAYLEITITAL